MRAQSTETNTLLHPGYNWSAGSTHDWPAKASPGGPFAWCSYTTPDINGMCDRISGYTTTMQDALREAEAAFSGRPDLQDTE